MWHRDERQYEQGSRMRKRHLITAGCLLASLGFYAAGLTSIAAFLVLGMAFELAFWVRFLRRSNQR
jgi:hypothetical protein